MSGRGSGGVPGRRERGEKTISVRPRIFRGEGKFVNSVLPGCVVRLNLPEEKYQRDMQASLFGLVLGSPAKSGSFFFPEVVDTPLFGGEGFFFRFGCSPPCCFPTFRGGRLLFCPSLGLRLFRRWRDPRNPWSLYARFASKINQKGNYVGTSLHAGHQLVAAQ